MADRAEIQSHGKLGMHVDIDNIYNHVTLPDGTPLTIIKIGNYFYLFFTKVVRPWPYQLYHWRWPCSVSIHHTVLPVRWHLPQPIPQMTPSQDMTNLDYPGKEIIHYNPLRGDFEVVLWTSLQSYVHHA